MEKPWDGTERRMQEEDRRQLCFMHKDAFDDLKGSVKLLFARTDEAATFRSQAKIVGVIGSLIFLGSFVYTYNHKIESIATHALHRQLIDNNTKRVLGMEGDYKALLVELRSLTAQISRSNTQNERLIDALIATSTVKPVTIDRGSTAGK